MIFVALLVLLILGVLVADRLLPGGLTGTRRPPGAEREARELRERYARGEIDAAEFNARLRELDARR
ncbi:MAG: SHOCT domain-containing protein [Pseudomonadota bacterium]